MKKSEFNTRALLCENEAAFRLGTMGADPYYGGEMLFPVGDNARRGIADRIHALDGRRLAGVLLPLAAGDDATFAYALGFLCHFLLDCYAHPYFESRFPGKLHTLAEIAIDPLAAARMGEGEPLSLPRAYCDLRDVPAIDGLHARMNWKLFALRTQGMYAGALKKWLWLYRLQFDPRGIKRALLKPFPRLTDYLITYNLPDERDLLNQNRAPWGGTHACAGRTESFFDLFDAAADEAALWMDLACAGREKGDYEPLLLRAEGRSADAAESL